MWLFLNFLKKTDQHSEENFEKKNDKVLDIFIHFNILYLNFTILVLKCMLKLE